MFLIYLLPCFVLSAGGCYWAARLTEIFGKNAAYPFWMWMVAAVASYPIYRFFRMKHRRERRAAYGLSLAFLMFQLVGRQYDILVTFGSGKSAGDFNRWLQCLNCAMMLAPILAWPLAEAFRRFENPSPAFQQGPKGAEHFTPEDGEEAQDEGRVIPRISKRMRQSAHAVPAFQRRMRGRTFFWLCTLILFLLWQPYHLAYVPGLAEYDSGYQLWQSWNHLYNASNPLFHTFVLGFFYLTGEKYATVNAGLFVFCALQQLLVAGSISYGLTVIRRHGAPRWLLVLSMLFFGLLPVFGVLSISMTKDVPYYAFTLVQLMLIWDGCRRMAVSPGKSNTQDAEEEGSGEPEPLQKTGKSWKEKTAAFRASRSHKSRIQGEDKLPLKWGYWALLTVVTILACLLRANALPAMFLFAPVMALICRNRAYRIRLLAFVTAGVALAYGINEGMIAAVKADHPLLRESMNVPIIQLARVINLHEEVAEELAAEKETEIAAALAKKTDPESIANLAENAEAENEGNPAGETEPSQSEKAAEQATEAKAEEKPEMFSLPMAYIPVLVDLAKWNWNLDSGNLGEFFSLWWKYARQYPRDYVDAMLMLNRGYWYVWDTSYSEIYGKSEELHMGVLPTRVTANIDTIHEECLLPAFKAHLEHLYSGNAFLEIPVYRLLFSPALYVWVLLFLFLAALLYRRWDVLMTEVYALMLLVALLLGPCCILRYALIYFLLVPMLAGMLLCGKSLQN